MRFQSLVTIFPLSVAILLSLSAQSSALSMLGTGVATPTETQASTVSAPPAPEPYYVEKRTLAAITEAMRVNRDHRRMFSDLTGGGRRDTALTKYIRALDVRYLILSAVGDSLLRATTREEASEANAVAESILAIRTDLDRAISTTQMSIIDSARLSKSYFGACSSKGELVDGTKCVRAERVTDGVPTQFWVQPWDAAKFDLFTPPE